MKKTLFLERGAREDLDGHITYLFEEAGEDVAARFVQAFEETASRLREQPELGRSYVPESGSLGGIRRFRISGFPRYVIFYRASERIQIERILHASRDIWALLGLEE